MTDTQTQEIPTNVDAQVPATGPELQTHNPAGAESPVDEPKGNREAKYRVERNAAREALTAAEARIADLQTREVERLAGEHLAQPGDIGLSGKALADYLTPEGWVDHDAVADAAAAVIESRPGLARNPKVRATDSTQGAGNASGKGQLQWTDLLKG
jgi:hypothetical protein